MNSTSEIRQAFLDFFAENGHRVVRSSSLVPGNDPTLLFTNAGMVQFKDVFLGVDQRDYTRAVTAQRCVRAGGKHNDLENVGYTARHHTFFEMLGNFSFGDYFKREAIEFAWEFLTVKCGLPAEKLWVTVYTEDAEAAAIWLDDIGVDPARFSRIGDKPGKRYDSDNFWAMGDTGPCGPCSEIFYDHGPEIPGGPPGSPDEDGDRYIEIWNLVFMQYDRAADGTLSPLPKPCVDTGMGLERLAAVLQGVHSNYDIDLFGHLIEAAGRLTGCEDRTHPSLKVIADHIRACAFLIADGVLPANDGRGYVLRRIIRRAIRHGFQVGCEQPFFAAMVEPLADVMGDAYPELRSVRDVIEKVLGTEEDRFRVTLKKGMKLVEKYIQPATFVMERLAGERNWKDYGLFASYSSGLYLDGVDDAFPSNIGVKLLLEPETSLAEVRRAVTDVYLENENHGGRFSEIIFVPVGFPRETIDELRTCLNLDEGLATSIWPVSSEQFKEMRVLDGKKIFHLYDTCGFPADLTADICRERAVKADLAGFEREMERQRNRARKASKFKDRLVLSDSVDIDVSSAPTDFVGYDTTIVTDSKVRRIIVGDETVDRLESGVSGILFLDKTPFYAESGGQVGDTGYIETKEARFRVKNTVRLGKKYHGHVGILESGEICLGASVQATVDQARRADIVRHHSATHLMHAALRDILGEHVQQKGSLVAPDRLRFDFSHFEPLSPAQIEAIEQRVNAQIQANARASAEEMDFDAALEAGALAFFGDKYGERVRVLRFGDYSTELCGGTHVARVGDIGAFKIIAETGISAGVRRIEAVAGRHAVAWMQDTERTLRNLSSQLKVGPEQLGERVGQLLERVRALEKELDRLQQKLASARSADLGSEAREIHGVRVLAVKLDGIDPNSLRDTVDQLKSRLGSAVIVLGTAGEQGVRLVAGVTPDLTARFEAGELVNHVATQVGGKGGGRPDFAQAGGSEPDKLDAAIESVFGWVEAKVG